MMRHVAANALTFLIIGLVILFGAATWAKRQYVAKGPLTEPLRFEVPQGDVMTRAADRLAEAGAISDSRIFRLAARYTDQDTGLRYGEYEIPAGASMKDVLELLNAGGNVIRQIVVPEGWSSFQVVEMLKSREELTGEIETVPPEGYLAPAGYDYQRGDTRQSVLDRMQERQEEILAEAWVGRAPDLPLGSPEELLILASIVEKETGQPEERPQVASVFVNRLERGMRLQTDPTVIYGITMGESVLGRGLRASELARRTDYNTYVIEGLPPTPIANPGRDAIFAAANPDDTGYLFFVADGTGGHAFAETLSEHNSNVAQWRRVEAQRAQEAREAEAASEAEAESTAGN